MLPVELTVPREEHTEEVFERKTEPRREGLLKVHVEAADRGLHVTPSGTGAQDLQVATSLFRAIRQLGIGELHSRRAMEKMTHVVEKEARRLWIKAASDHTQLGHLRRGNTRSP